ncbi:type III secretion system outer membrane ring subunit SctC [Endozoicomonas sp. Mp262]|uniref:type III secretion system outer membrane ring subunit SctC n=1 Tax=Endozoicomonas sp. Mp262 TaxID=2919499 RepID=UPI0021DF8E96
MPIKGTASSALRFILAFSFVLDAYAGVDWTPLDSQACIHWVRPGESLDVIAQGYGANVQELMHLNQLGESEQLLVGQGIQLPPHLDYCSPSMSDAEIQVEPPVDYNYVQEILDEGLGDNASSNPVSESYEKLDYVCGTDIAQMSVMNRPSPGSNKGDKIKKSPAESAFGDRPYAYYGSSESLADVLENFSASYYVPLVLAENVDGEVNGKIGPLTPVDFLEHMSNIYGFIWYFDGHTLYVYNANASQQQILSLSYMNAKDLKHTLEKVGVWDDRFFWKAQPEEGLVFISGPPRFVELVSRTAELLDAKEGMRQKSKLTVCTFKLKYAWATDKSFNFRGDQVTVPGVATLLQNIINGGGVARVSKKETTIPPIEPAARVSRSLKDKEQEVPAKDRGKKQLNEGTEAETVFINADPRLNAVIVHDLESKMAMYGKLVKALDKPTAQIEISVSIIDVSTSKLDALGVDYNNIRANELGEFKFDPNFADNERPAFTTILSARFNSFTANIQLLAKEGDARILSRPSILTLDNLEAVLDSSNTRYVKVEANQDAQLFPVTSGIVVQVTPRIVTEQDSRKIHMSINIEDGSDNTLPTDSAPRISNSSINTQAVVHESESLLIGGFYKENDSNSSTKIPVLGDLPVLGSLFRTDTETKSKVVRMFLITPRIVELKRT